MLIKKCVLSMVFCFAVACQTPVSLKDDFKEGTKADFWKSDTHTGNAAVRVIVTDEKGKPSLKFLVKSGDSFTRGDLREKNERSELYLDQKNNVDQPNVEVWYSFGLFVPEDFPITNTRLVMGQWKEVEWGVSAVNSPVVSNRFQNGEFFIKIKIKGKEKSFPIDNFKKGTWNKLTYKFVFSQEKGSVDVWNNNVKALSYFGPTLNDNVPVYFKCCLYRDHFDQDMSVYFAEFQKSSKEPSK